jgi:uncharacterized protein (UPF0179 family)
VRSPLREEARRLVTLVGSLQARVGYRFISSEPPSTCRECRLFHACVGVLEPGRVYEVVAVRRIKHSCPLHEGGVNVVEVEEATVEAALPSKIAVEGLIAQYRPPKCSLLDCEHRSLCQPLGLKEGDRCRVVEAKGLKLPCPRRFDLVRARLRRLPPS